MMNQLFAVLASLAVALPTAAQSFTDLGHVNGAALSDDGSAVVGFGGNGPFVWTEATGIVEIGEMNAVAVTNDGQRVLGTMLDPIQQKNAAGIWDMTSGTWTSLGGLPGSGCGLSYSSGYDMSDDGSVCVGLAWEGCDASAFEWTETSQQVVSLGVLGPFASRANAVSGDGKTIGGWDEGTTGTRRAIVWPETGPAKFVNMFPANPVGAGEVWGFSTDGRFAVGQGPEPFLYDAVTDTTIQLGLIAPLNPFDTTAMFAVADDGKTAVGTHGNFFGTGPKATIWTEAGGLQLLQTFLAAKGLVFPVPLQNGVDISADGRTILMVTADAGGGFYGNTFVVRLPNPIMDLGGSSAGVAGNPVLSAAGTFNPATNTEMRLENVGADLPTLLIISASTVQVPFVGGILHTFPIATTATIFATSAGDWDIDFNWPPNINSGVSLYFQSAVLFDPVAVSNIALSNALKITTP